MHVVCKSARNRLFHSRAGFTGDGFQSPNTWVNTTNGFHLNHKGAHQAWDPKPPLLEFVTVSHSLMQGRSQTKILVGGQIFLGLAQGPHQVNLKQF